MQVIKAKVEVILGRPRLREARPRDIATIPMTDEEFKELMARQKAADELLEELRHLNRVAWEPEEGD